MHQAAQPAASLRDRLTRHLDGASPQLRRNFVRHLIGATVVKIVAVVLIYNFFF
jgi:hypothetical protein